MPYRDTRVAIISNRLNVTQGHKPSYQTSFILSPFSFPRLHSPSLLYIFFKSCTFFSLPHLSLPLSHSPSLLHLLFKPSTFISLPHLSVPLSHSPSRLHLLFSNLEPSSFFNISLIPFHTLPRVPTFSFQTSTVFTLPHLSFPLSHSLSLLHLLLSNLAPSSLFHIYFFPFSFPPLRSLFILIANNSAQEFNVLTRDVNVFIFQKNDRFVMKTTTIENKTIVF